MKIDKHLSLHNTKEKTMTMEYTNKEKQIINSAWDTITYHLSKHNAFEYEAKRALKEDKKERSSITQSKAILIDSFVGGFGKPSQPISGLNWLARGCVEMMILGAAMSTRFPDDFTNKDHGQLIAAIFTQEEALKRNLAA